MQLPMPRYEVVDPKGNHRYTIQHPTRGLIGPLDSVTKIVGILDKPALIGWAAREAAGYFKTEILRLGARALTPAALDQIALDAAGAHRKKKEGAADLGTVAHAAFEAILGGREPAAVPRELEEAVRALKEWRLQSDIEIVAQELAIGSIEHLYGGRLDAVGHSPARGGWGIVDWKTSKGFYGNEYGYQTGGYAVAFEEQYGEPIQWIEIVRFGKQEPYDSEARPVVDVAAAKAGFIKLVGVSKSEKNPLIGNPSFSTAAPKAAATGAKASRKSTKDPALGF